MTESSGLRTAVVEKPKGSFVASVSDRGIVVWESPPFASRDEAERAAAARLITEQMRRDDKTLQMDLAAGLIERSVGDDDWGLSR